MKARLLNGETLEFQSDSHIMTVHHLKEHSGRPFFLIMFNGVAHKDAKTWPPIEREIERMCEKYKMTEEEE